MESLSELYQNYLHGAKNIVFLGEAGSGKTETAINLAMYIAREGGRAVHFLSLIHI